MSKWRCCVISVQQFHALGLRTLALTSDLLVWSVQPRIPRGGAAFHTQEGPGPSSPLGEAGSWEHPPPPRPPEACSSVTPAMAEDSGNEVLMPVCRDVPPQPAHLAPIFLCSWLLWASLWLCVSWEVRSRRQFSPPSVLSPPGSLPHRPWEAGWVGARGEDKGWSWQESWFLGELK